MTFDESNLVNFLTKVVMPEDIKNNVCNLGEIGAKEYEKFVEERINSDNIPIFSKMTKMKLKLWTAMRKKTTHTIDGKVMELKDDRNMFARMLIIARCRPDIDLKGTVGCYELTALPRSLFTRAGTLLPCNNKSNLMNVIEKS